MPAVAPSLTGVRTHVEADADGKQRCLRLLPGTHRKWHQLHGMGEAHTKDINRIDDAIDPRFADYPGEVDVPVAAGDLVVGDARLFHATHANTTGEYRTVICWGDARVRSFTPSAPCSIAFWASHSCFLTHPGKTVSSTTESPAS